ncbi:MAG TPA: TonB-dependent receptor, partial [Daejeonella sp.]|nr:TonB-dependent receptor [Daejeonella sp.]
MKARHSLLFPLLALLLMVFSFNSDDEPLKKLLTQLDKFRTSYPQEKVHLHLDKPYYAIGDNIWFKAYVVNSEQHQLSNLSKILYVELINEKDSVKQSLALPLEMGLAWGDFTLADTLREGNYRIRAYTTWMRNFGEEYFFDRNISIGNSITNQVITDVKYKFSPEGNGQKVQADIRYTDLEGKPLANKEVNYNIQLDFRNIAKGKGTTNDKGILQVTFINNQPFILKSGKIFTSIKLDNTKVVSKTIPVKATSNDVDVQFFPESGDLVQGIRSKVAFKALGADGLGVKVTGFLTDSKNNKLVDFQSEHAGMGYFALMPEAGEKYTAHIRFEDGSEKTYDLPRTLLQGYVLSASNLDPNDLLIRIAASPALTAGKEVTLMAQSNGVVKYISKVKMDMPSLNAKIPKNRFPTGILQLTLFSPDEEPVAERLVFIQHPDSLSLNMNSEKTDFRKREKVKLSLNAKDLTGKPEVGSFSLSVIDESKVPFNEADETTIFSNLLLTSDLQGFIEQPNYYFSNINENTIRQLDILMLSQGWRRFTWKNIMAGSFHPLLFPPENNMHISGRVLANNGKPVVGGKVTLFS